MGRHAVQRRQATLSLVAAGAVLVLGAGLLSVNGMATAEPRKLSDNLVGNPDFEGGTGGWNAQAPNTTLSLGAGRESRRAAKVTATGAARTLLLNDSPNVVSRSTAGATYLASVWVRSDAPRISATLRFREVNGRALAGRGQASLVLDGTGWQQLTAEYVAAGDGHQIAVQVLTGRVSQGASVSIDDVDVRQVLTDAEPDPKPSDPAPEGSDKGTDGAGPDEQESSKPEPSESESAKPEPSKSESAKPEPADPPAAPKGKTLFGASVYTGGGTSFDDALKQSNANYGGLEIVRVFHPSLPTAWPGKAGTTGGPVVVSFKANPKQVVAGQLDDFFADWFKKAPRDRDIYWTNYHEPEDNIEDGAFTAAQYRDALRRLDSLADAAGNPRLHTTTIWMCYDLKPGSGRDWRDYYPGSDVVDVMGWDCYNRGAKTGAYDSPASLLDGLREVSESMGKPWGLGEYASKLAPGDSGQGRAEWLRDSANYLRQHDASWVCYFDNFAGSVANPEYRLKDAPSQGAWRWAVSES